MFPINKNTEQSNMLTIMERMRRLEDRFSKLSKIEVPKKSAKQIIAIEYEEFTGTQSASVASGANFAITNLSITHSLAKSTNKLLLLGQVGIVASSSGYANSGAAFAVDGTLIAIADAASNRGRMSAHSIPYNASTTMHQSRFIMAEYEPGSTASKTYTLRLINIQLTTVTVYVNRTENDSDSIYRPRGASFLWLIEYEV